MADNESKPFANDKLIAKEFERLAKEFNIKTIVETGTFKGVTTMYLSSIFNKVYTVEINSKFAFIAKNKFKNVNNVTILEGSSPSVLSYLIPKIKSLRPLMFFLDAHWYKYNPLRDELRNIANYGLNDSIIAIHDFKVPEKDFGYDTYGNIVYQWDYIKDLIEKIYGRDNYRYHYNKEAEGARRGIIYIYPRV